MTADTTRHLRPTLPWSDLSKREAEVAKWPIQGYNRGEVAEILYISPNTVRVHTTTIYKKLEIRNQVELSYFGMRDHFLHENQQLYLF